MKTLDRNKVNRYLMHKQHLSQDSKTDDILRITRDIMGLHATVPATSYLSLLARTRQFNKDMLAKRSMKRRHSLGLSAFGTPYSSFPKI